MKKAVFNWSGGKDSALALQTVLDENEFEVISFAHAYERETLNSSKIAAKKISYVKTNKK